MGLLSSFTLVEFVIRWFFDIRVSLVMAVLPIAIHHLIFASQLPVFVNFALRYMNYFTSILPICAAVNSFSADIILIFTLFIASSTSLVTHVTRISSTESPRSVVSSTYRGLIFSCPHTRHVFLYSNR